MMFLLSGCGADVSTKMTVDENFAGKRVIKLFISDDDLGKVTGGINGLKNVVKKNIPKAMSYKVASAEGGKNITFTIAFKDIKDYRTKVTSIINAGVTAEEKTKGNLLVPEVVYEKNESYFKKGIKFTENFDSVDLLDWFREALRKAKIISESESNWFEYGDTVLVMEGTEYTPGRQLKVDTQENTCLDSLDVTTKILLDNTIERTIVFSANEETVTKLSEKGCELETYFKDFVSGDDTFKAEQNEEYGGWKYTFSIKADTAEALTEKTNKIMQTETNTFVLEATVDPEKTGFAKVNIKENIDASFYLDFGSSREVVSNIYVYNNAELIKLAAGEAEVSYNKTEDGTGITYYPSSTLEYDFSYDWQIEFEKLKLDVDSSFFGDDVTVTLDCELFDALSKEMKDSAKKRIQEFLDSEESYKTDDNGITIEITGAAKDVEKKLNDMIGKAAQSAKVETVQENSEEYYEEEPKEEPVENEGYFTIETEEVTTGNIFTDGKVLKVDYNLAPVFGEAQIKVENKSDFLSAKYYQGDVTTDKDAKYVFASGNIAVYKLTPSIIGFGIGLVTLILLVVGIILLLGSLKKLKEYLAEQKKVRAEKAKAIAEQNAAAQAAAATQAAAQNVVQANVQVPVTEAPAPVVAETAVQVETKVEAVQETEEEEELL